MISKDKCLYNSDPLIGQWNQTQNITNFQWQICIYFWTFFFLNTHTRTHTAFSSEGFKSANRRYERSCVTGDLIQAWKKYIY